MDSSLPPVATARTAGGLYLAVVVLSIFALGGSRGIIEAADPAATAANLARGAPDFRIAVVANLVATLFYIAVVGLLNELLRPVQPAISRLAVLFGLSGCIVGATAVALQLTAPALIVSADMAATAPSAQALLIAGSRALGVGLTLFGCYCLLLGWLVYRSTFIPRIFGALLILSGAMWLAGNLAILVDPRLSEQFLLVVGVAALGEIAFTLWLLIRGVNASRWHASVDRYKQARLGA